MHSHEHAVAAARESGRPARGRAERPEDGLLGALQRSAGNQAVTFLLQRQPRERPAPTDAPGAKKAPKRGKAAPKAPAADIRAKVIGFQVEGRSLLIKISAGTDQGVKVGMAGALLKADGAEYADVTIEQASSGQSVGRTTATQDQVAANRDVIIKASKFREEGPGGEF